MEAIIADRNRAQKHVARARVILWPAERMNVADIARRSAISRPAVWRWQRHFAEEGAEGLLRDKETGLSLRSIQRIWQAHDLQPHRIRTFKRSRDPDFAAKLEDIVGLYMSPPAHALVLSIDETSQIQALDRTQPGLPLKPGQAGTMTHDYVRHGTTTLFAALNVLDGTVLGRCRPRHRHQEFIRFLNAIERAVPAGRVIHVILGNDAAHKHEKVRQWLARHPRWVFHFTPTSGSGLNAVESFFSALTRRRLKRAVLRSIAELQAAIKRYLAEHNADPKPFTWTKTASKITDKLTKVNASGH